MRWHKHIELSPSLDSIRPLFVEWVELYSRACEEFLQTPDRYFLEQTLSGLIVAAGWKTGFPAVSEIRVRRMRESVGRRGKADVLVKANNVEVAIETKIRWFNDDGTLEEAIEKLNEACADANRLRILPRERSEYALP